LLFVEDRELLNARYPMHNPAINWSRFGLALYDQALHVLIPSHDTPGASTLATQIVKYRHSPEGRTHSGIEKLAQMASASSMAYLHGKNTLSSRRQIVVAYLNTVPLSALPGYGEINGFADGMLAWYGIDFAKFNAILTSRTENKAQALVYKQALSLIIAQRRPSYYLQEGAPQLLELTNSHLRLLADDGVISPLLLKLALPLPLNLKTKRNVDVQTSFVSNKAVNMLRNDLATLLHTPSFYELDRLDLSVQSTLDADAQRAVTDMLLSVQSAQGARAAGLYGRNMLREKDDTSRLSFSFSLLERTNQGNLLRVQTDNLDQPFDINSGSRLNLGSTAKLRTLITYLQIITGLHHRYARKNTQELNKIRQDKHDVLTRWAVDYFAAHPHSSLTETLEAAMLRPYSANPEEAFFTGSGKQRFTNFESSENSQIMTVRDGFAHSVNLVFVRLMRDIVRYYQHKAAGFDIEQADATRQATLARFADKEGREFLQRFYKKYYGLSAIEIEQTLLDGVRVQPVRLTIVFRSLYPEADFEHYSAFMRKQLPQANPSLLMFEKYAVDQYSLNDRGYLVGIHPLELWLVSFLSHHPKATLSEVFSASLLQRQNVYQWLFKTHNKNKQESRIRQMMELDAFSDIADNWQKTGYPFKALTPSLATALGASGDRPLALAELMGIIVNNGVLMPVRTLQGLRFAQGTPYETQFIHAPASRVRVLPEEIAIIVRRSLFEVVQKGTGVRLKGGFSGADGTSIEIGGKTGTGDQRFVSYAKNGSVIESRAVNRSATFVFEIGEHFFGTITAYVHEPYAANFNFTSAMTVQLLKSLIPALQPVVARPVNLPFAITPPTKVRS
jgi:membrane peptidoglycan carboxypeptidase